eukprot:3446299-Rhodomonas_salina.3
MLQSWWKRDGFVEWGATPCMRLPKPGTGSAACTTRIAHRCQRRWLVHGPWPPGSVGEDFGVEKRSLRTDRDAPPIPLLPLAAPRVHFQPRKDPGSTAAVRTGVMADRMQARCRPETHLLHLVHLAPHIPRF